MKSKKKIWSIVLAIFSLYTPVGATENLQMTTELSIMEEAIRAEMNRPVVRNSTIASSPLLLEQYKKTTKVIEKKEESPCAITLNDVVKAAIYHNRDIKLSRLSLMQAETEVSVAAAAKNPSLHYNWRYTRMKPVAKTVEMTIPAQNAGMAPKNVSVILNHLYSQEVSVNWPIWTGGAAEGAISAARYAKNLANVNVYQVEADAKLEAVKAYYQYVEAVHLSQIAAETVGNLDKHRINVERQYEAGIVAKLDVLSSRVALANAKQKNIAAENGKKLAEANINRIMGKPMDRILMVKHTEFPEPQFTLTSEEAVAIGQKYRWELVKADYAVKIAKEKIRIAKAGYMPKVVLGGQYGWNTAGINGLDSGNWGVYGAVSLDLFDGGATANKVKDAKEELEITQQNLLKAREGIELEIRQDYFNVISAKEQIKTAAATLEQAEEAYKIAVVRYTSGVGINLDVLDAELALNQAKINHITALYNYNIGLAVLEKAIGIPAVIHEEFH